MTPEPFSHPLPDDPTILVELTDREIDALVEAAAPEGGWIIDLHEHRAALESAIEKLQAAQRN